MNHWCKWTETAGLHQKVPNLRLQVVMLRIFIINNIDYKNTTEQLGWYKMWQM